MILKSVITRNILLSTFLLLTTFLLPQAALSANTPAGTIISNTVTLTYAIGAVSNLSVSASTSLVVDNRVNVVVTKNADANVMPGSMNEVLIFTVTNVGNATQRYALSFTNSAGVVMNNVRIFLDDGTTLNGYDAADTLYVDASTFGDVAVDGTFNILIVADVPLTIPDGGTSDYQLVATTVDAGTTNVTVETAGADTSGVDVVFADINGSAAGDINRDGKHSATGSYMANLPTLDIIKTALIYYESSVGTNDGTLANNWADCTVCPTAKPGAIIRYSLEISVTGGGTATAVIITDLIPVYSTYNTGTLKLEGALLTDMSDGDDGDVGGTTANTVTVHLGDMTNASLPQTITFDVTIDAWP